MDREDIRTLKILEEIDNDHTPSQRDLSKKLNISLGLVNSFVKRLANKGYFKINNIPKNRVKYILTPKGAAEKTRLTYQYIQHSFEFYRNAREKLHNLFKYLNKQGVRRVVFYGTGDFAEIAFISLQETSIQMSAIVDDNKSGEKFLGGVVKDPASLNSLSFDRILITTMISKDKVLEKVLEQGVPQSKVVLLE
ncbi:MAG: winged helix-turn-helix transcriptional regulator [Desulfobacterales bacterium]|jgi:DNA-binding MarR family transcriptional regulator